MGVAASSVNECCTRRSDGTACCDLNSSVFGEDAFYRDAFYDCDEGNRSHDRLFSAAREQARLKMRKGRVFAKYAAFAVKQRAANAKNQISECMVAPKGSTQEESRRMRSLEATAGTAESDSWLGSTIPEWTGRDFPETGVGPFWSKGGRGGGLKVRCGPNYMKSGTKAESCGGMYETISCDAITASTKIESIMGNLVQSPPVLEECESDRGGGSALQWTSGCPLPRVICINMMLPYETGLNPFKKDAGCSFVGFFHIKPETIHALKQKKPPACIRALCAFCAGPCGKPDGPDKDPDRSLHSRVMKGKKKDWQSGLFKAIAKCVNPEDVHVPDTFHTYNGKPCLITKCGYIVKDPAGEWLEIGVDVRGFNILARKMLCSFRALLPKTKIHYGFLIQGVEDDEMPEGLICDMFMYGVNMVDDPVAVDYEGSKEQPMCAEPSM